MAAASRRSHSTGIKRAQKAWRSTSPRAQPAGRRNTAKAQAARPRG